MAKGGFKTNGRRGSQQITQFARTPCLWRRRQPEMNVSRARLASACRGDHFTSSESKLQKCRVQEMQGKVSPKNTACEHCGRFFTARGVKEHVRHHCPANPNRRKRVFTKSKCLHCGKRMHSAGLRVHVASVHPEKYARSRSVKAHRAPEKPKKSEAKEAGRHSKESPRRVSASPARHARSKALKKNSPASKSKEEQPNRIWKEVEKRAREGRLGSATSLRRKQKP